MLMNDTTFLLDESMDTLKSIRELQDLMENTTEWNRLSKVNDKVGPSDSIIETSVRIHVLESSCCLSLICANW